ncbi:MAG: hypothetical protein ACTSVI_11405 [Promethearchaeota archaeon]
MGYVPKYVLKRMVPQDAIKKVDGGLELSVINMIATIPVDQIPGDPIDLIEIKFNGEALSSDVMKKIELRFDDETYLLPNLVDAGTIPVNKTVVFYFPIEDYKVGDEITIEINIPIVSASVEFTRSVH